MKNDVLTEKTIQSYGDLLFDLCESMLWNSANAQLAFRKIMKSIEDGREHIESSHHERARILRTACDELRKLYPDHARKLTQQEQLELTSISDISDRVRDFDRYFHRLNEEEQMVLLLKDKYGLPYSEISLAMGFPEGTVKIKRGQALRALEGWLWENPA